MPPPVERLKPIAIESQLANQGLSNRAIASVTRLGDFASRNKWWFLSALALAATATKTYANFALHPEYGTLSNLGSFILDTEQVPEKGVLNALLVWSHNALLLALGSGLIGGVKEVMENPRILSGEAENPYRQMILMVDATNVPEEGSFHGDHYQEAQRYLAHHPKIKKQIEAKHGRVCEIVPANTPKPTKKPKVYYFRAHAPNNNAFLTDTVRAGRSTATVSVLMSRSHTVWDPSSETRTFYLPDTIENMNDTITDTLGTADIPRIVVLNQGATINQPGIFDPKTGRTFIPPPVPAEEYFKQKGYLVVNAEKEVMSALKQRFKERGYKRILLVNDSTETGQKISKAWHDDYIKSKKEEDPEIISVGSTSYEQTVKSGNFDAVFVLGSDDTKVASTVNSILDSQKTLAFKNVPMEVLLEGRGASDKLGRLEEDQRKGKLHYVHEYLASAWIKLLL